MRKYTRLNPRFIFAFLTFGFLYFSGCTNPANSITPTAAVSPEPTQIATIIPVPSEMPVTEIPLEGPLNSSSSELSGLAWYGEYLVLLPQYPSRVNDSLYALPKEAVLTFLEGRGEGPLTPQPIPLLDEGVANIIGFEGYEAIAFMGNDVYLTIESSPPEGMLGFLAKGQINPDLSMITVDIATAVEIPPQAELENYTDETLLITPAGPLTIYEANGALVNINPVAHQYNSTMEMLGMISFPNIEYRITDATELDENGRFWAINYLFPGDRTKLRPIPAPQAAQYVIGETHRNSAAVERLVEFQYASSAITLSGTLPIQLKLLENDEARNWEGIVRLDDRGFLLVTDRFPETILAFVPLP